VKSGPPPAGHGHGAPELAWADAVADAVADAAPDAASVTVARIVAAARQERTIPGILTIFAIAELPPTHRHVR
jgi:hypothetical protein